MLAQILRVGTPRGEIDSQVSATEDFFVRLMGLTIFVLAFVPLIFGAEYAALRAGVNGFEWIPDQIPRFRDLWKKTA